MAVLCLPGDNPGPPAEKIRGSDVTGMAQRGGHP